MSPPGDVKTDDLWPSKNANLRKLQKANIQFIYPFIHASCHTGHNFKLMKL